MMILDEILPSEIEDTIRALRDITELEAKIQFLIMGHFSGHEPGLPCVYLSLIACARTISTMISTAPPEYRALMCSALFKGILSLDETLSTDYLVSTAALATAMADSQSSTQH